MADKTKTIKNATDIELDELMVRLRKENEVQELVAALVRKSTVWDKYSDLPSYERLGISTEVPIESLYHKTDETLAHFGILGMHWGIRRPTGPDGLIKGSKLQKSGFTKEEEKAIKIKKNALLNEAVGVEAEIDKYVSSKLSESTKKSLEDMWEAEEYDEKKVNRYLDEYVSLANKGLSERKSPLSKGFKMTYKNDPKYIDMDDLSVHTKNSYNGKEINFAFKFRPDESDKVFLEEPNEIEHLDKTEKTLAHFGILGMHWGVRRPVGPDGLIRSSKRRPVAEEYVHVHELKKRSSKVLSNKDIKDINARLQLEKSLRDLKRADLTQGQETVKAILAIGTTMASVYALGSTPAGQALTKAIMKTVTKRSLLDKVMSDSLAREGARETFKYVKRFTPKSFTSFVRS